MLMNGFGRDMVKTFLVDGKYAAITEYAKICHPDENELIVESYDGNEVRVYVDEDQVHLMCPSQMSTIQTESVADAVAKGTIFDDAEAVDNHAQFVTMNSIPVRAMSKSGLDEPKHLRIVVSGIIGRMADDGTIEISVTDMMNGKQFIDQLKECNMKDDCDHSDEINKLTDHYLGAKDHYALPKKLKSDIGKLDGEVKSITSVDDEDGIGDEDYEYMDMGDGDTEHEEFEHRDEDSPYEEAFFSKKPKKLKPIPRDVIAYITVEMNAVKDSNSQAMLAGYTCSKLDLVDFYINVIDVQDERYIVPHTRQYLVQMQSDLNRLLQQILNIRPRNFGNPRLWKAGVTLPEGR